MGDGGGYMPSESKARTDNRVDLLIREKCQNNQVKIHWLRDLQASQNLSLARHVSTR